MKNTPVHLFDAVIFFELNFYEYIVDGLSLESSSLSSSPRCLRMRNITPTHTSKVPQLESGMSHVADIYSVHWHSKLAILSLLWKFNACERASTL